MADKKIITDELLKLQTEKMLQVIADNVYQEEEYNTQEIDNMFDATPQEISYYESLINPDVVSENRLWSSKTIDEKLASAILEANKYTDEAATRNLTTEIVTATSEVTKENVLYLILSDASTNTYEQYMLIGGVATALGSTQVDLSNIYNKSEIDSKLDVKANKSEVLSVDSVQATTGSETNDTVYSSKLTKDELDKKVNVSDITTTIDSNSTNDTITGTKAIYDYILANTDKFARNYSGDLNNVPFVKANCTNCYTVYSVNCTNLPSTNNGTLYCTYYGDNSWGTQLFVEMATGDVYSRCVNNGTWTNWIKVIRNNDITQTINSSSTDTQVPSAKAVETRVNKVNKCTVHSNEDLNLITEPGLYACVGGDTYGATHNFPVADNGYLQHIVYPADGYCMQTFVPNGVWGGQLNMYVRRQIGGVWSSWQRLCGTTIADVPLTTIPLKDGYGGTVAYSVKNGYCLVLINGLTVPTSTSGATEFGNVKLPCNRSNLGWILMTNIDGDCGTLVTVDVHGILMHHKSDSTKTYFGQYMYEVKES